MVGFHNNKVVAKICFLSLCAITLSSCATRKEILAFKMDTLHLLMQFDSLHVEQKRLHLLLTKDLGLAEKNAETETRQNADLQIQFDQIVRQLEFLNERMEESNRRISALSVKVKQADPVSLSAVDLVETADLPETPDFAADTSKVSVQYQFPGSVRLYDLSYQDLVNGNYDLARQGFIQYLRLLPNGELADDSQYWVGESYYVEKNFPAAIKVFETLLANYPDSDRVPATMLKLAYAQIELGQKKSGRAKLALLIKQYNGTNEARLAQERLQEIN